MDNLSTASTRSTSSNCTPGHVYSPLPIRTTPLLSFSAKFSIENLGEASKRSKNAHNAELGIPGNKLIYKKFLDLVREDLENEPR